MQPCAQKPIANMHYMNNMAEGLQLSRITGLLSKLCQCWRKELSPLTLSVCSGKVTGSFEVKVCFMRAVPQPLV